MDPKERYRQEKIRKMRLRRPVCKTMCWDGILADLDEMRYDIDEGRWMYGPYERMGESAVDELGEDTVYELQIAFSDLDTELQKMDEDMRNLRITENEFFYQDDDSEYDDPPVLFDCFFPAINYHDRMWGYDIEEHDYYGIEYGDEDYARKQAKERLKRLTKDKLIDLAGQCMEIARQYMSLRGRYDGLSTALAILKGEFEAQLEMVQHIEALYDEAEKETHGFQHTISKALYSLDSALNNLPDRLWVE